MLLTQQNLHGVSIICGAVGEYELLHYRNPQIVPTLSSIRILLVFSLSVNSVLNPEGNGLWTVCSIPLPKQIAQIPADLMFFQYFITK